MLTQTIAQDKYNIYRSETIVGSFFMSRQFQKLVSTFFKNKNNSGLSVLKLVAGWNVQDTYICNY